MAFGISAGAYLVGGAAIGSALIGANAAGSASDKQSQSAAAAQATQLHMYNQTRDDQAPWRQAGNNALSSLSGYMGLPTQSRVFDSAGYDKANKDYQNSLQGQSQYGYTPLGLPTGGSSAEMWNATGSSPVPASAAPNKDDYYTNQTTPGDPNAQGMHQFNASDLNASLAPNYKFMLDQGLGAVNNQASVGGGLVGGNALKGINDYAQNYAQNGYQQAYNNYNANQTNIFNRLSNIAGLGQTSVGQTGNIGANLAGNIGSAQMAGGAAQAAGIMGTGKAISGGMNNISSMYQTGMLGNSASSGLSSNADYAANGWIG